MQRRYCAFCLIELFPLNPRLRAKVKQDGRLVDLESMGHLETAVAEGWQIETLGGFEHEPLAVTSYDGTDLCLSHLLTVSTTQQRRGLFRR